MLLSGIQFRIHLNSRLKRAGMTDFGLAFEQTQEAAGNEHASDSRNLKLSHCPLRGSLDFRVKGFLNSYSFRNGMIDGHL